MKPTRCHRYIIINPTREQIASDFSLWMEYVDPSGIDTEESFDAMSIERKIEIQNECFGPEENERGNL